MKTTADFLDALRAKLELPSDGRLADHLGMHRQHVSRYRTLGVSFDDEMSLKVADILELDPVFVVACMHAQREKNAAVRKVWEKIATLSIGATACALVFLALPFGALPNGDAGIIATTQTAAITGPVYIMSNWLAAYWPFLALFSALLLALPRHTPTGK